MLQPPVIVTPVTDWTPSQNETYYTSDLVQRITGTIPVPSGLQSNRLLTVAYRYKIKRGGSETEWSSYSLAGVTVGETDPEAEDVAWSFNTKGYIDLVQGDQLTLNFKALEFTNNVGTIGLQFDESAAINLVVKIVSVNEINPSVTVPTGVQIEQSRDWIKLLIPSEGFEINDNSDFLGCNFYLSLEEGGGSTGYVLINDYYVSDTDSTESEETEAEQSTATSEADNIKVVNTVYVQDRTEYYTYTINKMVLRNMVLDGKISNVFLSDNETLNDDLNFYFVTTAIAYDNVLNQVVESDQSIELTGAFIRYSTDFGGLPQRSRPDVLFSMTKRLTSNNPQVNVVTGQVIRDILDAVSDECSKQYFIQNFVFRSESVDSLLIFDDADGDGVSDNVSTSTNKRLLANALNVTDPNVLQELIDQQFDKLASNYDLSRRGAVAASGTVLFYTARRPTFDLQIPEGTVVTYPGDTDLNISPVNFFVVGSRVIEAENADSYYNPVESRYEVQAEIRAESTGTAGNLPARSITVATGIEPSLSVINETPTNYGSEEESNQQLAARIKLARSSFDSGTKPGYLATSYGVPGVVEVNVQAGNDPLMVRDWDSIENRHLGGKVDVYIRGSNITQTIDQVAFKFEYPTDVVGSLSAEQFFVVDAREFRIKTNNPKVTAETPIVLVNSVKNVTRGLTYDLTDIDIISDTIILSNTSQVNLSIGMATLDVIEVDYRYRSSNVLYFQNQPVRNITSVVDKDGAPVQDSEYSIIKKENPLSNGLSTISKDGIEFLFDSENDIDQFINITNEEHNIRINSPAVLVYKGVDRSSIVVRSSDDPNLEYKLDVDYSVTLGDQTTATELSIKPNGMIRSGDRILVDYNASTNLFVTYSFNQLLQAVQTSIDKMKHACGDTVVKEAVENFIDLSFQIERDVNVTQGNSSLTTNDESRLRSRIQTAIYNVVASKKMGQTLTQAELIKALFKVKGVKSVSTPFTMMQKRDGSFIPFDDLGYLSFEVYQRTANGGITSYQTINSVLSYSTSENGGNPDFFRTVYEDNIALELVNDPTKVADASGRAYIQSDGRIIVSTRDGRPPQSKYYNAAYYVSYPSGTMVAQDIQTDPIEYVNVDSLSFRGIDFIN